MRRWRCVGVGAEVCRAAIDVICRKGEQVRARCALELAALLIHVRKQESEVGRSGIGRLDTCGRRAVVGQTQLVLRKQELIVAPDDGRRHREIAEHVDIDLELDLGAVAVIEIELPIGRRVVRGVRKSEQRCRRDARHGGSCDPEACPRHRPLEHADIAEIIVISRAALAIGPAGAQGDPLLRFPVGVNLAGVFTRGAGVEPREVVVLITIGGAEIDRIDRPPGGLGAGILSDIADHERDSPASIVGGRSLGATRHR